MAADTDRSPINFPPPPPPDATATPAPAPPVPPVRIEGNTITETPPVTTPADPLNERARTLAEALEGIAMPCDLAPLMGNGSLDPREVSFFTRDQVPAKVGGAIADELERLGYEISPVDDRSIRAERGQNLVRARIVSAATDSEEVFAELHPSAPKDSVVVELKLV
ncbi:MAG: hypothetical protein ACI9C1_002820 [Candidatus Aldehydirespiratoraceae bacterium]|jgi:hypothetical protein